MRPSRDLRILQRGSLKRIARLRGFAGNHLLDPASAVSGGHARSRDLVVAYTVIELDNVWARTALSLFLSTAFLARDGTGARVVLSSVPPPKDAAEALKQSGERDDGWWRHRALLRGLGKLGASNVPQVQMALNAAPDVFEHLHTFRNFYAHRGHGTRQRVEMSLGQLQFPRHYTATQALTLPRPTRRDARPQPLVLDWLDEMRITIELLV